MDALTLSTVCILCAAQPSSAPASIAQWEPIIAEASTRFAVPEAWIRRVIRSESGGRTTRNGKPITSSAGAMGLMQIMPGTYANLRRRYGIGANPYDPHDNIFAGTAYLRQMYERYGYPFLFAAYHAGSKRFDGFLFQGRALPRATLEYVNAIVPGSVSAMRTAAVDSKSLARDETIFPADYLLLAISGAPNAPTTLTGVADARRVHSTNAIFVTTQTGAALFVSLAHSVNIRRKQW
jgi:hypothetical protein